MPENIWYFENFCVLLQEISDIGYLESKLKKEFVMTALNIQAVQNETDEACMVQEEFCMTKEEMLSGFGNALHELKSYREGKLELKPLEDVLNEL